MSLSQKHAEFFAKLVSLLTEYNAVIRPTTSYHSQKHAKRVGEITVRICDQAKPHTVAQEYFSRSLSEYHNDLTMGGTEIYLGPRIRAIDLGSMVEDSLEGSETSEEDSSEPKQA